MYQSNRWATACLLVLQLAISGCLDWENVAWMPDGKHIVYAAEESIWLIGLNGKQDKLLHMPEQTVQYIIPSPDGRKIALLTDKPELSVINSRGEIIWRGSLPETELWYFPGVWSPGGEMLAITCYVGNEEDTKEEDTIVVDFDNDEARRLKVKMTPQGLDSRGNIVLIPSILGISRNEKPISMLVNPHTGELRKKKWRLPIGDKKYGVIVLKVIKDGYSIWCMTADHVLLINRRGKLLFKSRIIPPALSCFSADFMSYIGEKSGDGYYFVDAEENRTINIGSMLEKIKMATIGKDEEENYEVSALALSPDGEYIAVRSGNGLCIGNIESGDVKVLARW